ncbi:unnamed protein product [Arctia plantaginis]|uniref:Uncharacterized protein n=1 Tax=Arctia plantaginis TaxID=874455 RepID=A0A8S1BDT1_ARCPL|nr:unnamed protein product [Arctia plantaginis]
MQQPYGAWGFLPGHDGSEAKSDVPVEQLEKLKNAESGKSEMSSSHVEYHRLDTVASNGELESRLEEHGSVHAEGGEKPRVHAQAQLDVPSEGVHRVLVQDGAHISIHDVTASTTVANEETTPKVFHGAARLVQPGSSTNSNPLSTHTAIRRAFNTDIPKQTKNIIDHYGTYTSGIPYSPLDMAEYVFWTGDERGVTTVIEDFLLEGMMSKEEAINFLQEIKFNIDYLRTHYAQNLKAVEENTQQEKLRNMLIEQANAGEYQYRSPALQTMPFGGNNPDIMRSLVFKNWELNNNISPIPSLPVTNDRRPEPFKRTYDPRLQINYMGASDYDRDGPINAEEEYDEIMERLKPADTLYPEYTLEIIYQLAKMMFSQSLFQDPASARAATQQFMTFLELEAEKGQMSRSIEKKVLDVMIAALTDTIADHPDLLHSHDSFAINPPTRRMPQYFKPSQSEPGMSRAVLAAFKDELLKGLTQRKFAYSERN